MNPARIARVVRRASLALAGLALLYLVARFDTQHLPAEGCSPLFGVSPGSRLLIDRWAGTPQAGQAVLFESAPGRLHLGRVGAAPEDLSTALAGRLALGELWIAVDAEDCPGLDSRSLGPIAPAAVRGPVVLVF